MTAKVLLATNNAKKLAELRRILDAQSLDIQILALADVESYPEPAETEWTFEGNALIKARAGVAASGLPTLADDSGLCVDALGGMPGVRSSRWAGPQHDDQANLELVLAQIDDVEPGRRAAHFVSVMALVMPDGREFTTRGEMPGELALAASGPNGFGYDPIFIPTEQDGPGRLTAAQLTGEQKDAISHRGRSIAAMLPVLAEQLGIDSED